MPSSRSGSGSIEYNPMKIIRGTKNIFGPISYPVVAIGNFDGVHIGHQIIFHKAVELASANEGTSIAFTFEPPAQGHRAEKGSSPVDHVS